MNKYFCLIISLVYLLGCNKVPDSSAKGPTLCPEHKIVLVKKIYKNGIKVKGEKFPFPGMLEPKYTIQKEKIMHKISLVCSTCEVEYQKINELNIFILENISPERHQIK